MTKVLSNPTGNTAGKLRRIGGSWLAPVAVAALSICVTITVWLYLRHNEEQSYTEDLTSEIALITVELRDRLRAQGEFLRGVRAILEIHPDISPAQWAAYSQRLDVERYNTSLVSYAFAARVQPADVKAFTDAARRRHQQPLFTITPPPALDDAYVVTHIAPQSDRALRAIGSDMFAEAKRQSTIKSARDTDNVSMSGRIALAGDQKESALQPSLKKTLPPAFLMVLPVYRHGQRPRTVIERRQNISGIVVAAFRMNEFMESLNYSRQGRVSMRIFDDESFNASTEKAGLTLLYDTFGNLDRQLGLLEEREIEFGQRRWLVQFRPKEALPIIRESSLMLLGGLTISLLLGMLTWNQSTRRRQAEIYARKVNAELHHSEERFKLASQGTNDGIWDYEFGGNRIYASGRLEELLGYTPGSMPSEMNFLVSRIHPEDVTAFRSANIRHIKEHLPYDIEYRMLKSDNSWGWFRSRGQAVWNPAGRAVRMAGSVADISQRKEAEAQLRHYKDFLHTVLKSIPHPIFVKNREGEYIMANTAMCTLANRDENSFIGARYFNSAALFTESTEKLAEMDAQVFQTGKAQSDEFELPINGRGLRTIIVSKTLATDPDGKPILIGAVADVTEQRHAEYAMLQTNRKLQSVLDAATEIAIIATDTQGVIKTFNRGAEKMLGYDASDMINRQSPAILHVESELLERCAQLSTELGRPIAGFDAFTAIPQTRGAELREWTYVRKDGSRLTVNLAVTAARDEENEISGYLGIAIDISERKRAEAELLHHRDHLRELVAEQTSGLLLAKEIAEKASQTKSEFLANMSHEMRTPMHAVLSFAGLGEEKSAALQAEKLQHYFQRIRQSGERLLRLLNDLLDLSKLEAGKMHVEPRLHDVRPLITEACDEFESLLSSRHIQLSIEAAGCDTEAMCDPVRFGQVIRNLLSNAIKFSPDRGRVVITFERGTKTLGRRMDEKTTLPILRIRVSDEGIGIPPAELGAIFEKFVQSSKTKSGAGGTGLGLAICQEIMHAHRGTIEACNNAGQGASFILELQVNPAVFNHLPSREA